MGNSNFRLDPEQFRSIATEIGSLGTEFATEVAEFTSALSEDGDGIGDDEFGQAFLQNFLGPVEDATEMLDGVVSLLGSLQKRFTAVADAVTTTDRDFESAVEKITGLLDENGKG
ncbi:hypothetical protein [Nocardia pseudovaccinii]|uniref:hypothetical protein n=1 Tax=Nocardia pseudovaccinii TaxID=189540 RepID=UPI0007A53C93|nr:hypothetical protein [Nocardia pseudovaccinii]